MTCSLVDGLPSETVSVADRGLLYGDGLFETVAVRGGRLCLWSAHLARLRLGARRLGIPCPPSDLLHEECLRVVDGTADCVVRLTLTRGNGGRGYRPPAAPVPTRLLSRHPWPEHPPTWAQEGVSVDLCHMTLGENPRLAGLKHLNRLEQVLARAEWGDPQRAEGLMRDGRGRVIAGTMSNLFLVAGRRLLTPRLDTCGIAGTVRGLALAMAPDFGLEAMEGDLSLADLEAADGLFLTNALIGIWPVSRLGDIRFDLGRLPRAFLAAVRTAAHSADEDDRGPCGRS
jgi:4-amino-4-deoxychorismate lyase